MREETEEPADKHLALSLVSPVGFQVLCSWDSLHDTRPAGDRQGTPVSKGEKDPCAGVSMAH